MGAFPLKIFTHLYMPIISDCLGNHDPQMALTDSSIAAPKQVKSKVWRPLALDSGSGHARLDCSRPRARQ